jgi:hypothetical protein
MRVGGERGDCATDELWALGAREIEVFLVGKHVLRTHKSGIEGDDRDVALTQLASHVGHHPIDRRVGEAIGHRRDVLLRRERGDEDDQSPAAVDHCTGDETGSDVGSPDRGRHRACERDNPCSIQFQAVLPKIKKMPSAKAALAYLSKTPTTKGGREVDAALAKLKKLGYIQNTS